MARFTAANARENAARSVAARKAAEAERTAKPASIPLQATLPADTVPGISVACVRARLETLDVLMSKAKSDREWDNLTRAFDRMFRVWCVLTKTPGPGSRKPAPERGERGRIGDLRPLGIAGAQVAAPIQPAKPMGGEYDPPPPMPVAPLPG